MNIDPLLSMALAVHTQPGAYCLLLGSGVSRSARIPTGWELTLELVRRVALVEGADPGANPEKWFVERFGDNPNYSNVVELLSRSREERQSILRPFFEPNAEDKAAGRKTPTSGHAAIARLVEGGHIRVILTTNFDRLLEQALEANGVIPKVVATEDAIDGMMPLQHSTALVVKLHGDFLDTRIRNTSDELDEYPPRTRELLDRILTEYGLIVCGWSGEWDTALRDAILRTTRHRFSTFWLSRGEPKGKAAEIVQHRNAQVVLIEGADEAFGTLAERVAVLAAGRVPDPYTPAIATEEAKRYVADPRHEVRFHDLLMKEVEAVRKRTGPEEMSWSLAEHTDEKYRERVERVEAACAKLIPVVAVGVYHGGENLDELWPRTVKRLLTRGETPSSYNRALRALSHYPALLVSFTIGICSLALGRFDHLWEILVNTKVSETKYDDAEHVFHLIPAAYVLDYEAAQCLVRDKLNNPESKHKTPGSTWLAERLWGMLEPVLHDHTLFEEQFGRLEYLLALLNTDAGFGVPYGQFAWMNGRRSQTQHAQDIKASVRDHDGIGYSLLTSGFFGGNPDRLLKAVANVESEVVNVSFR